MDNTPSLAISEDFYSVQGEGPTTGTPSIFIRLKNCNLCCGLSNEDLAKIKQAGEGALVNGNYQGELHKTGLATWTCDSAPVWLHGHRKPYSYLIDRWSSQQMREGKSLLDWVSAGRVNLIWTGGEPTIAAHQRDIVGFLEQLEELFACSNRPTGAVYNEIETNGTNYIQDGLFERLSQINCSVKLANSGMGVIRRIVPSALERIISHENHWFKFVVSNESDLEEIYRDFIEPFNISPMRTIIMPGLDDQANYFERTHFVLEMAKKYGVIGMSRLHIAAWGAVTGV